MTAGAPSVSAASVPARFGLAFGAWPTRLVASRSLRRLCRERRAVCLTFDDGPGESLTRGVLQVLSSHQARATFFAVGSRAAGSGAVLDEAAAAGHEIGCHTARHLSAWSTWRAAARDVRDGYAQLSRWVPAGGLFRPPYGRMNPATMAEIRRRGAAVAWWTIDSGDTHAVLPRAESASELLSRDGGGVVLLHDFDRSSETRERAAFVIRATESTLSAARREGIRVLRLGDLLHEAVQNHASVEPSRALASEHE